MTIRDIKRVGFALLFPAAGLTSVCLFFVFGDLLACTGGGTQEGCGWSGLLLIPCILGLAVAVATVIIGLGMVTARTRSRLAPGVLAILYMFGMAIVVTNGADWRFKLFAVIAFGIAPLYILGKVFLFTAQRHDPSAP